MAEVALVIPEATSGVGLIKDLLKEQYGVFSVDVLGGVALDPQVEAPRMPSMLVADGRVDFGDVTALIDEHDELTWALSTFARDYLRFGTEALSIRSDHSQLETYMAPGGSLDVLAEPRTWIMGNAFMDMVASRDPRYRNLVDFITERRGLFIKPSAYKTQRNHWNAPTNGGLPIVRKRDETHEGTFMAHDLEHFAIQDPVPFSFSNDPEMLRIYLRHRMASEATTLVLTDMLAVHVADLKGQGYDTTKRKIFPLFESLLPAFEGENVSTIARRLMEANIHYALTGDTSRFQEMGADPDALSAYVDKYEVFFSADYDWNKENFLRVQREAEVNPRLLDYFTDIRTDYGIPMIEDLYPETGQVSDIMSSFSDQVEEAFDYQGTETSTFQGRRLAAVKYLAGQQVAFYRFGDLEGADEALAAFKDACLSLQGSEGWEDMSAHYATANNIYQAFIARCADHGRIDPQEHELYRMHAPLYPPLFINYAKQSGDYRNLQEKMTQDGIYC